VGIKMQERSVELEEKGNQQFKRYCPGCKHCVIPKRLKEDIKNFKPVPGPWSVRVKVQGYSKGIYVNG